MSLLTSTAAVAQPLDEAARTLAKKVGTRLASGEAAHVAGRNFTSLPATELTKALTQFTRNFRRTGQSTAEITLALSETPGGYLLVAQVHHNGDQFVETMPFQVAVTRAPAAVRPAIQKTLLWEQDEPILDLVFRGDQMLVLEPGAIVTYRRMLDAGWVRGVSTPSGLPPSRDPRGMIVADSASLPVAPPTAYTIAQWKNLDFVAETDGVVRVYGDLHQQVASIPGWGSDVAEVGCGVMTTGPGDRSTTDTVTAWDFADRRPIQLSETLEMPGPVTALWSRPSGALAVVYNLSTKRYAAYSLTLDCPHY